MNHMSKSPLIVLQSRNPNKEIIVINDGSMDETMLKIESWIQCNKLEIFQKPIKRGNSNNQIDYSICGEDDTFFK